MTREMAGMRVLIGLTLWGMAEIAAFVVVGSWIGVVGVLALVAGTGLLGIMLLRRQGMAAVGQMRSGFVMLRPQALGESGLLVLGGVLLVLPGLLTDLVGLMLLVPAVRRWLLAFVTTKVRTAAQQGDLLEGIAVEVEAPRLQPDATGQKPSGWTRP
ncbi:MAG: FxsA family protein [Candidatus Saccharibacteria bacterium]|nr:FxsA family protein [Pseudorhodobacter sp.]